MGLTFLSKKGSDIRSLFVIHVQSPSISNFLNSAPPPRLEQKRIKHHAIDGWKELDLVGPMNGQDIFDVEQKFKQWLKKQIGLMPNKHENWSTSKMKVKSLSQLKEKSGIETSIF